MIHNLPQMETINKTAKITNLPKYFVRQLVLQRKIKYVKAGKKYLVNVDNLIEYLNTGDTYSHIIKNRDIQIANRMDEFFTNLKQPCWDLNKLEFIFKHKFPRASFNLMMKNHKNSMGILNWQLEDLVVANT